MGKVHYESGDVLPCCTYVRPTAALLRRPVCPPVVGPLVQERGTTAESGLQVQKATLVFCGDPHLCRVDGGQALWGGGKYTGWVYPTASWNGTGELVPEPYLVELEDGSIKQRTHSNGKCADPPPPPAFWMAAKANKV